MIPATSTPGVGVGILRQGRVKRLAGFPILLAAVVSTASAPSAEDSTEPSRRDSLGSLPEDSTTAPFLPRALRTGGGIVGANLGVAAWNRYVQDAEYARIDGQTIWNNLAHEWVWDDDNFQVNQIGHPMQGSLYYSLARANGFGYLPGLAWTTVGSIHWEYFMETEPPAMNDLVTTRMGGAMLGEMTWRLAEYVSGESTGKPGGWIRRSAAFAINPVHGADRLLNGRPPVAKSPSRLMGLRISTGKSFGKGLTRTSGDLPASAPEARVPVASTTLRLSHGDPFASKKPFDHFTLSLGLSALSTPVSGVGVRAQLWRLPEMESDISRHSFHFTQNFDYLDGDVYRLSASSFGAEWLAEFDLGADWTLRTRGQPIFIALGAASTEYYVDVERDYNFGIGPGWKTGFHVGRPGTASLVAFADRYWIRTQSGAQGAEIVDLQSVELVKDLWRGFGVGLSWNRYDRTGSYRDFPDVRVVNQEFRALATWTH